MMAFSQCRYNAAARPAEDDDAVLSDECKEMLLSLPIKRGWRTNYIYLYQNFWCQPSEIQAIMSFQRHFKAKDSDVLIASLPKSGTTWLKALAFATLYRKDFNSKEDHPLRHSFSHDLVPFAEYQLYANNQIPDFSSWLEPRLLGTHIPFASLPNSINKSDCKIVYICRNPFDTFISTWHFMNKSKSPSLNPLSLEEAFGNYCEGIIGYGPFWTHLLGYWNESIAKPHKVLFLKYEEMKEDPTFHVKRLALFLDCPFSVEEERKGAVENIVQLCSFENMKEMEVNKSGDFIKAFDNKNFFRKAKVGDWANYLSPTMVEKLSKVAEQKLRGSGLSFKFFS